MAQNQNKYCQKWTARCDKVFGILKDKGYTVTVELGMRGYVIGVRADHRTVVGLNARFEKYKDIKFVRTL